MELADHREACRLLPCCAPGCGSSPSHAHHVTYGRGKSQKAPHSQVIPLCWKCHSEFHGAYGRFKGWTREQRNDWQREQVSRHWPALTPDVF